MRFDTGNISLHYSLAHSQLTDRGEVHYLKGSSAVSSPLCDNLTDVRLLSLWSLSATAVPGALQSQIITVDKSYIKAALGHFTSWCSHQISPDQLSEGRHVMKRNVRKLFFLALNFLHRWIRNVNYT